MDIEHPVKKSEREKKWVLISSCPGYQLSLGFLITTSVLAVSLSLQHSHYMRLNQTFNEEQTGNTYKPLHHYVPSHFDKYKIVMFFRTVSTLKLWNFKSICLIELCQMGQNQQDRNSTVGKIP